VRRREFIKLFGGTVTAWPLAAHAQQPTTPMIGFLRSASLGATLLSRSVRAWRTPGSSRVEMSRSNIHSAENDQDRLAALVSDLIRQQVAVIVRNIGAAGLVANLNRPGGNATGVSFLAAQLGSKRLELLLQLVPRTTTIGVIVSTDNSALREFVAVGGLMS
jgi:putative tryptophan/tyrosine transport system substrate-binding protein